MMKALITAVVGIIVITVFVSVLAASNQTAIGTTAMSVLNQVPVFIALVILGVLAALVYNAFKNSGDKGI